VIERRQTRYRLDDDRKIIARVTAARKKRNPQGKPLESGLAADWLRFRKEYAKVAGGEQTLAACEGRQHKSRSTVSLVRPKGLIKGARRDCRPSGHPKEWSKEGRLVTDWTTIARSSPGWRPLLDKWPARESCRKRSCNRLAKVPQGIRQGCEKANARRIFERKSDTEAKLRWKVIRPQGLTMGSRRACQQGGHSKGWSTEGRAVTDWPKVARSSPRQRPLVSKKPARGSCREWICSRLATVPQGIRQGRRKPTEVGFSREKPARKPSYGGNSPGRKGWRWEAAEPASKAVIRKDGRPRAEPLPTGLMCRKVCPKVMAAWQRVTRKGDLPKADLQPTGYGPARDTPRL